MVYTEGRETLYDEPGDIESYSADTDDMEDRLIAAIDGDEWVDENYDETVQEFKLIYDQLVLDTLTTYEKNYLDWRYNPPDPDIPSPASYDAMTRWSTARKSWNFRVVKRAEAKLLQALKSQYPDLYDVFSKRVS